MKKYIEDSLILTKEAMELYIHQQRQQQAAEYGSPLDQYLNAIASGSVVQSKSSSDISPKQ